MCYSILILIISTGTSRYFFPAQPLKKDYLDVILTKTNLKIDIVSLNVDGKLVVNSCIVIGKAIHTKCPY